MSTKSKRRAVRRAHLAEGHVPVGAEKKRIEGQVVGVLLNAITFGAVDAPASKRAPEAR